MESEWDPRKGERLSVGWRTVRDALLEAGAESRTALADKARRHSDLREKTCWNLVRTSIRYGYLSWDGRLCRLTEKGRAAR